MKTPDVPKMPEWTLIPGFNDILYAKSVEGIAKITINRPEVRNAFRPRTLFELRDAFELARTRPRRKVTAAHKEPVYRLACGMFAEECRKVARVYPDVTFEEMMIDSISMKLVTAPQQFDVVVTTNQFGDILTDIGAGLVGGLGLAPGLCVGERQAMGAATPRPAGSEP